MRQAGVDGGKSVKKVYKRTRNLPEQSLYPSIKMLKKTLALVFALSMIIGTTSAGAIENQTDLESVCNFANGDKTVANIACSETCRRQGNASGSCDAKNICKCVPKKQSAKGGAESKHDEDDDKN